MKIFKTWLLVAVVTSALAFVGTRVLADSALHIEQGAVNISVTYDGNGDFLQGGNNQDVIIDEILSWPGTVGGSTYTGWSLLAADASGSMDVFSSSSSLKSLGYTPTVGDNISITATYSPYHAIPEIATATAVTLNSSGNPQMVGSKQATIPAVLANPGPWPLPLAQNLEGYLVEIDNVTISGQGTVVNFPATNSGTAGLGNLYLNDTSHNQLTMYFWRSSYACDSAMVGAPIPTWPVNVFGLLTAFPSVSGTTTNWQDELIPTAFVGIPEPSSVMLAGIGLLGLIAVLRRRHS